MVPFRFQLPFVVLPLVLSCFVAISTGCSPPRSEAIGTEDGQVATEFTADMVDDGTPVAADPAQADDELEVDK